MKCHKPDSVYDDILSFIKVLNFKIFTFNIFVIILLERRWSVSSSPSFPYFIISDIHFCFVYWLLLVTEKQPVPLLDTREFMENLKVHDV